MERKQERASPAAVDVDAGAALSSVGPPCPPTLSNLKAALHLYLKSISSGVSITNLVKTPNFTQLQLSVSTANHAWSLINKIVNEVCTRSTAEVRRQAVAHLIDSLVCTPKERHTEQLKLIVSDFIQLS